MFYSNLPFHSDEKTGGTIKVSDYIDAAKSGKTAPSCCSMWFAATELNMNLTYPF